jgi:hypothetical protein
MRGECVRSKWQMGVTLRFFVPFKQAIQIHLLHAFRSQKRYCSWENLYWRDLQVAVSSLLMKYLLISNLSSASAGQGTHF